MCHVCLLCKWALKKVKIFNVESETIRKEFCCENILVDLRMIEVNKNYLKISEWMGAIA